VISRHKLHLMTLEVERLRDSVTEKSGVGAEFLSWNSSSSSRDVPSIFSASAVASLDVPEPDAPTMVARRIIADG
jgi:hypothetical protein